MSAGGLGPLQSVVLSQSSFIEPERSITTTMSAAFWRCQVRATSSTFLCPIQKMGSRVAVAVEATSLQAPPAAPAPLWNEPCQPELLSTAPAWPMVG